MQPIMVTVTVESFDEFLHIFATRGLPLRERHGSRGVQVMRHANDEERVSLLFDWDAAAFQTFLLDPEVQASMRAGGTLGPPDVVHLNAPTQLHA